jgi:hypothetical protein
MSWATHPPDNDTIWIPPKTLISFYHGFLFVDVDLYIVNNAKKYPVVVFTACSNNKYTESSSCIGWKMVSKRNGGSIATFAEAGIGHGPGGLPFVDSGIGWMEVKVFDELFNTKKLGDVWANCVSGYYNNFDPSLDKIDYQTMLQFSLFGDPTLVIEDGDDPVNVPVNLPVFNDFLLRLNVNFPLLSQLFQLLFN